MNRKTNTRKELLVSILALLLCVSMLVGSTFAWFTDSVTSGLNNIEAGNLDIELYADGAQVDANTALFNDIALWEPGVVTYENLKVANVGTLALQYKMTLNVANENYLEGHGLSEVLKVAIIDKIADGATREDVMAAANAANPTALNLFNESGVLLAGEQSAEKTVVIFWAPNADEIDNLYNANNGKLTSDREALHISFGINLQASQQMEESDSFGKDYDKEAAIVPNAGVNNLGPKTINARLYDGSLSSNIDALDLDFTMQFLPNESKEQAASSIYRYYHADFVVKADKEVPANSIALAGYYEAWCSLIDNNWVYLTAGENIPADTEVRLVEMLGTTVNYEEICEYGNDGTGFLCGATALSDELAGTSITVELRLYETTGDYDTDYGSKNEETGEYLTVGTYSYTF